MKNDATENRQRQLDTFLCRPTDRAPFLVGGGWNETVERWKKENRDNWSLGVTGDPQPVNINIDFGLCPRFEWREIRRDDRYVISRTDTGIVRRDSLDMPSNMPEFIDYPVHNEEDWRKIKHRFENPDDPTRFMFFTRDWIREAQLARAEGHLLILGRYPYGEFGTLRDLMGVENLLLAFYDQPDLIDEMITTLTDLWLGIYRQVVKVFKPDILHLWEDMAGKQGPLISPAMVRRFMGSAYRRIKQFAEENGIPVFSVDTDGNCRDLIPVFLELGVNHMYPFEVQAGNDVVQYRTHYPTLSMAGGIEKRCIAQGPGAIDRELARIESLLKWEAPGYIPQPDHAVPPDAPWENWVYFNRRLWELIRDCAR